MLSSLSRTQKFGAAALAVLLVIAVFFHLFALVGIGVAGTTLYVFDHTVGARLYRWWHNSRNPEALPPGDEHGVLFFERGMKYRAAAAALVFGLFYAVMFMKGAAGLGDFVNMPAQFIAFCAGILCGPLGYEAWQGRDRLFKKGDQLEADLKAGTIDPLALARDTAHKVGAGLSTVVAQGAEGFGQIAGGFVAGAKPATPPPVAAEPAPPTPEIAPAPSAPAVEDPLERIKRFTQGGEKGVSPDDTRH